MRIDKETHPALNERNDELVKLLAIHEPFLVHVSDVRRAFGVPNEGFKEWNDGMMWDLHLKTDDPKVFFRYRETIQELVRKFRLPLSVWGAVNVFVRTNHMPMPQLVGYDLFSEHELFESGPLNVRINQRLTEQDWELLKKEVETEWSDRKVGEQKRPRKRTKIDRDIAILRASRAGETIPDIELAARIFPGKIEDEEFDISAAADRRRAQQIRQARHRLRKLLVERFGDA